MSDCRVSLILVFEYTPKCNDRGVLVLAIRLLEPWILEPSLVSTPQLSTIAWMCTQCISRLSSPYVHCKCFTYLPAVIS